MTRRYATVHAGIWDDPDFQTLSIPAQRMYLMLISQTGLNPAGIVPITLRRWATYTPGGDIEGLSKALRELAEAYFIVIDWDREEILVRSFVRWDHGHTNEKRCKAIVSAAQAVKSPGLASALAFELDRLDVKHGMSASPIDARSMPHRRPIEGTSKAHAMGDRSPLVPVTLVGSTPEPEPEPQPGTATGNHHVEVSEVAHASNARDEEHRVEDEPRSRPVAMAARKIARAYTDLVKLNDTGKICGIITNAQAAGYPDNEIRNALTRLANNRMPVTPDTLRIEIEGAKTHLPPGMTVDANGTYRQNGKPVAGKGWTD